MARDSHRSVEQTAELFAGRYRLLGLLGEGGMAAVLRAQDTRDGAEVALKRLTLVGDNDARRTLLFEREYSTLAGLKHPRIISVFDYGVAASGPYYTMELLDGADLRTLAPLSWRDACRYLRDAASSLALLHAQRVVHRDVTPRNIRITQDGAAKLLDFGAISPFGTADDVTGTAPFIPPEAVHGLALDQRADIFGLGATAYWVLTRKHAYLASGLADLAKSWARQLPSVQSLQPDVPQPLSELIASMLSLDPAERPASMAVVIDQLTAIGNLPAEPEQLLATSYLRSAPLIGRDAELERIKQRLGRAYVGRGGVAVIEGTAGSGKTHLLANVLLRAKLLGFVVARAQARAHQDPYTLLRALVDGLLANMPADAVALAVKQAPVLRYLARRLPDALAALPTTTLPADPREQRGWIQGELLRWILPTTMRTPIVLAIDDVHLADEPSLAWITSLTRHAGARSLLIVCTERTGSTESSTLLRTLAQAAIRLTLSPLTRADSERLVETMFGDVPELRPLAHAIHEHAGGNPQRTVELVEHLVRTGSARYVEGSWQLPRRLTESTLPTGASGVLLSRLASIGAAARELLQSLSVCRGPFSLPLCATLTARGDNDTSAATRHLVFPLIGELVTNGLVLALNESFVFAHEPMREAVYAALEPNKRALLHGRVAAALLADAHDPALQLEAGWHLLHAGREQEGADLLERAGLHFAYGTDGFALAVPALEAALEVYRAQGRKPEECLRLTVPLSTAGLYLDYRAALRHVPQTFAVLHDLAGLDTAQRASAVGHKVALGVALGVGAARHLVADRDTRLPRYRDLLTSFAAVAGVRAAVALAAFDLEELDRTLVGLHPLTWLGPGPGRVVYDFASIMRAVVLGQEREALDKCQAVSDSLDSEALRSVPDALRLQWRAGLLNTLGLITSHAPDNRCLQYAEALEAMGTSRYQMYAAQIRMVHHAVRGEAQPAEALRRQVETYAIQEASTWRMELIVSVRLLTAYAVSGDVSGLKRVTKVFERYAADIPSIAPWHERARRAWLASRTSVAGTNAESSEGTSDPPSAPPTPLELPAVLMRVASLNRAGDHASAAELSDQMLAALGEQQDLTCAQVALTAEAAVAHARLGRGHAAEQTLEQLLQQSGAWDNPLLHGILLEARAKVAQATGDAAAVDSFSEQAEAAYRATDNPLLLARGRGLHHAAAPGPEPKKRTTTIRRRGVALQLDEAFRDAANTDDRARIALSVIGKQAQPRAVALYLIDDNQLRRYDDGETTLLPDDADDRARAHLSALVEDEERTEDHDFGDLAFTTHTFIREESSPSATGNHISFTLIPVVLPSTEAPTPVAVIVIAHDVARPPVLTTTFLHALAHALHTQP